MGSMVLGVWVYNSKQNRKSLCLLRAASDRVKVSLLLEHDRGHLSDPTGCWPPKGHSRDHLGDWDKSRERAGFPGSNSSRRNYFQVTPPFAYKHETVQKYSNVKPFCKITEEVIGQILPNELSKHTLRISLGLLGVHFSYILKCFISQGRETQVT